MDDGSWWIVLLISTPPLSSLHIMISPPDMNVVGWSEGGRYVMEFGGRDRIGSIII